MSDFRRCRWPTVFSHCELGKRSGGHPSAVRVPIAFSTTFARPFSVPDLDTVDALTWEIERDD
jgi:hypothetical protein